MQSDPVKTDSRADRTAAAPISPSKRSASPQTWQWAVNMVRRGGIVNFFGGCPNDSTRQPGHRPAALLRNHLQGQLPPHAGLHPQGAGSGLRGPHHGVLLRQPRGAAGQSAGSDAAPDEPQRPPEDGHRSVDAGVPAHSRCFCRRPSSCRSPEALGRAWTHGGGAAPTRAGWPPITTRISTWSASCCPSACTRISTTSTPTAAGRTIWATRSAIAPRACACSPGGAANWTAMYAGRASHPVFVALGRHGARRYGIPREPFADLIHGFVQDQTVTRYRDWDELFDYCRYSANPVGRLVLYLCGYSDDERQRLSDATCTALQLANFWQDVTVDLAQGPRLHAARRAGAPRLHGGGSVRAPLHRRRSARPCARCCGQARASCSWRACRWWAWWTGGWRSISTCSAAAACACSTRSSGRTTTCWPRGRPSPRWSACGLLLASLARTAFSRGGVMQRHRAILRLLPARGAHAAPRISTTPSCCFRRQQRKAMCAIYAFMRYCDDLSDEPGATRAAIERWRSEMEAALEGRFGGHPVWPAFHHTVRRFGIPHQYFREMIDGVVSDLEPRRFETFDELYRYCYQVASVVGLTIIHIFGFDTPSALPLAEKCGVAFQLTNILRDIREDAGRGRIYLPGRRPAPLRRRGRGSARRPPQRRLHRADALRSRPRARLLPGIAPAAGPDPSAQPAVAVGPDRHLFAPARAHRAKATTMCSHGGCVFRRLRNRGLWCAPWRRRRGFPTPPSGSEFLEAGELPARRLCGPGRVSGGNTARSGGLIPRSGSSGADRPPAPGRPADV